MNRNPSILAAEREQLAGILAERGWSQRELARRVGSNQSYISLILSGARDGNIQTWKLIADALDMEWVLQPKQRGSKDVPAGPAA